MKDLFDKDITVVNRFFDKKSKKSGYKVSYVKGFWSSEDGISINGTHLIKNDGLTARILMSQKGYQTSKDFNDQINELIVEETNPISLGEINSLPVRMFANIGWTLQNGDYLVKGKVKDFSNMNRLLEGHQDVMKITKIGVKDYGSKDMWHWAITGA